MRKLLGIFAAGFALWSLLFSIHPKLVIAGGPLSLTVSEAYICLDVVDLQCQGKDTTFSSGLGKLYCFTRIVGAEQPTQIFHIWYYKNRRRARVALQVNSCNWRTYSSKIIQRGETGDWRVEILGPDKQLLKVIHFQVVPE